MCTSQLFKGILHSKMISVTIYSPSCCSKPFWVSFFCNIKEDILRKGSMVFVIQCKSIVTKTFVANIFENIFFYVPQMKEIHLNLSPEERILLAYLHIHSHGNSSCCCHFTFWTYLQKLCLFYLFTSVSILVLLDFMAFITLLMWALLILTLLFSQCTKLEDSQYNLQKEFLSCIIYGQYN